MNILEKIAAHHLLQHLPGWEAIVLAHGRRHAGEDNHLWCTGGHFILEHFEGQCEVPSTNIRGFVCFALGFCKPSQHLAETVVELEFGVHTPFAAIVAR